MTRGAIRVSVLVLLCAVTSALGACAVAANQPSEATQSTEPPTPSATIVLSAPSCDLVPSAVMKDKLGVVVREPQTIGETELAAMGVTLHDALWCAFTGPAGGYPGNVASVAFISAATAQRFATDKEQDADLYKVTPADYPGLGDEAYTFTTNPFWGTVHDLTARRGSLCIAVTSMASVDAEAGLIRYLFDRVV